MNNIDLLITEDDLTLNSAGIPEHVSKRGCIAQDIQHMIRESGLLVALIGHRDRGKIALNLKEIEIKVEQDNRIQPGTAKIIQAEGSQLIITANTIQYGLIKVLL